MSCQNGFRAVKKTGCRALPFSFPTGISPLLTMDSKKNPRNSSVINVLLPIVVNKRVSHQFWTYWKTIRVSLNSSLITKRSIVVLAILGSHFVTVFMFQV